MLTFRPVADTYNNREKSLTPKVIYSGRCQCFLYLYAYWHCAIWIHLGTPGRKQGISPTFLVPDSLWDVCVQVCVGNLHMDLHIGNP